MVGILCRLSIGSLNVNYKLIEREILTQPSRYKRAESILLADEKGLYHLLCIHTNTIIIHTFNGSRILISDTPIKDLYIFFSGVNFGGIKEKILKFKLI